MENILFRFAKKNKINSVVLRLSQVIGGRSVNNYFSDLKKNGFNSFWKKLNGNFLLVLSLGIGISLISFVKISANLLENFPLYIWSFFLGLIFATIYVIYKMINHWSSYRLYLQRYHHRAYIMAYCS